MSRLRHLIQELRAEILSPRHDPTFARAKRRRLALAKHADIAAVLGALASECASGVIEREALTQALLKEHHARPKTRPFLSSVLLVAYYPMLSRLRHRITSAALLSEDLDQVVLTSFLTVLEQLPRQSAGRHVVLALRQRTKRLVLGMLRQGSDMQSMIVLTEDGAEPTPTDTVLRSDGRASAMVELMTFAARCCLPAERIELIASKVGRETLRDRIRRAAIEAALRQ